jgi:hypothetical protein
MKFNPVSSTHTADGGSTPRSAAQHKHLPTAPQGLLEPDAGKARQSGSEGAPAQQCAGATRQVLDTGWRGRLTDFPEVLRTVTGLEIYRTWG